MWVLTYISYGDSSIATSIDGDLAQWLLQGTAQDIHTRHLIASRLYLIQHRDSSDQHRTTTSHDAFFNSGACRGKSILNAMLLLFQFDLCGGTNFNHANTADQLCQALLELFTIIIAGSYFYQSTNLLHASLDLLF